MLTEEFDIKKGGQPVHVRVVAIGVPVNGFATDCIAKSIILESLFVLLPDALIMTVACHLEAIPMVMRTENNDANGRTYNITLGVCSRRYWIIRRIGGFSA